MPTAAEVQALATSLPEAERAALAAYLLRSLPPLSLDDEADDEEEVAEALRRDAEMEADPRLALSQEQFDQRFAAARLRR